MGIYLSTPKTGKSSEDGENNRLRYGVSSMQGWRATMEDAHAAIPNLDESASFFGVYDGHGGKAVAKFCAKYLHQQVLKHEAYSAGDFGTTLKKSFLSGPNSGCTACVAIIQQNQLVFANAGDSRCVLSRKGEVELCDEDEFLVIACDGIWDCMSSQQLVDFVQAELKTENNLSVVCEKVFDRCLAPTAGGEGCDNMTMILIQFKKTSSNAPLSSSQPSEAESVQALQE